MPPKSKITKEMIIDAAFAIARKEGAEKITARAISEYLKCSTQPVLYHFATIEEIKKAAYGKTNEFHEGYLMNIPEICDNPLTGLGMNYVRFAIEEKHLFRFLFQSNEFSGASMLELMESEDANGILGVLLEEMKITMEDAKEIFLILFIYVHGYASMYANNEMVYDEVEFVSRLEKIFEVSVNCVIGGCASSSMQ